MNSEFCEHLDAYGELFAETEIAYQVCVNLIGQRQGGDFSDSLVKQIQTALKDWQRQTRTLRSNFVVLKEKGSVLLPRKGQNTSPVCSHCGMIVPRLEFPDFQFKDGGQAMFRGKELAVSEPAPV